MWVNKNVRFFTMQSTFNLFDKAGFNVVDLSATVLDRCEFPNEILDVLTKFGYNVSTLAEHSQHYQYLVKAELLSVDIQTSIIIPVYNKLEYTRQTIDSIFLRTQTNFELILIDNNSNPETKSYLLDLSRENSNVKVITNEENLGFPKAINQGLEEATGKYVVIANNDIIVNKDWLNRFMEVVESKNSIH